MRGRRAVACFAKVAVVLAGDVSSNQFALGAGQRIWSAQEYFGQSPQRLCGFGAISHRAGDSRQAFWPVSYTHLDVYKRQAWGAVERGHISMC